MDSMDNHSRYRYDGSFSYLEVPVTFSQSVPGCDLGVTEERQIVIVLGLTLIMSVNLTGNTVVILVLGLVTKLKNDLNNYLLNLAVADLLVSVFCMPPKTVYIMSEDWVFGYSSCSLFVAIQHTVLVVSTLTLTMIGINRYQSRRNGSQTTVLMVSTLTLTMIGIDRYMAVKSPLQSRRNGSQSKSNILIIWMIAAGFSLIPSVMSRARRERHCGREVTVCGDDFSVAATRFEAYYQLLLLVCECAVPLVILVYTYSVVCLRLWGRRLPGNADQNRDLTVIRNKKKTIKMLICIVLLFAICLMPMQLYHFIGVTSLRSLIAENTRFTIYFACHWLGMIHSGINPVIYGFMNENFRADAMKLLRCSSPCVRSLKRRRRHQRGVPMRSTLNRTSTSLMTTQTSHTSSGQMTSTILVTREASDTRPNRLSTVSTTSDCHNRGEDRR